MTIDARGNAVQRRHGGGLHAKIDRTGVRGGAVVTGTTLSSIRAFQRASTSANTRRGYDTDWKAFAAWCENRGYESRPAEPLVVAAYLAESAELVDRAGEWFYAPGTISRWLASINKAHLLSGYPKPGAHPEVSETMAGIRRERARPIDKKTPLLIADLKRVIGEFQHNQWPTGVIAHRDHAMLLIGFAGAYRRSELASLDLRDISPHPEDGLHIRLRKSKTDQEGAGAITGIPFGANPVTCPVCAYVRWRRILDASTGPREQVIRLIRETNLEHHVCRQQLPPAIGNTAMPLFRPVMKNGAIKPRPISGNVVNDMVQRRVEAAGYDKTRYGGHSLRAGFVTQAFRAGATHHEVMRQTRHRNINTVEGYSRDNDPLAHNAVTRLGL